MTARLLPHKELIALLCRRCYGESIKDLAEDYCLTYAQVVGLIDSHGRIYKNMQVFLGRYPRTEAAIKRPTPVKVIWRNCKFCFKEFCTESRFIYTCTKCKKTEEWQGAG